jgi:hypothetical protein
MPTETQTTALNLAITALNDAQRIIEDIKGDSETELESLEEVEDDEQDKDEISQVSDFIDVLGNASEAIGEAISATEDCK